jgi:methylmalonyl-CoA/ethylmalonyl-CoA epimerase
MKIKRVSHISIAVKRLESHLEIFERLFGLPHGEITDVPSQGVRVAFIDTPNIRIELIEPTSETATVQKFLAKRGEGLHHISFEVEDVAESLAMLSESGAGLIDHEARTGAEGKRVAFVHPMSTGGVLIELEEE